MENFKAITQSSIDKCKSIGVNADQLDALVSEFKLDHNLVANLLHRASTLVEYDHFDCHALGQLLSGDYKVTVELTDDNLTFCSKSGVDIPMYIDDDPTNFCSNSTCRKAIYDHSEYCDDTCRTSDI